MRISHSKCSAPTESCAMPVAASKDLDSGWAAMVSQIDLHCEIANWMRVARDMTQMSAAIIAFRVMHAEEFGNGAKVP